MVRDILLGLVAVVVYCGWALAFPTRRCPTCHGTRVKPGKRPGICPRCKGTARTQRFGGTAIHRFFWSVVNEIKEQGREQQERAERNLR